MKRTLNNYLNASEKNFTQGKSIRLPSTKLINTYLNSQEKRFKKPMNNTKTQSLSSGSILFENKVKGNTAQSKLKSQTTAQSKLKSQNNISNRMYNHMKHATQPINSRHPNQEKLTNNNIKKLVKQLLSRLKNR